MRVSRIRKAPAYLNSITFDICRKKVLRSPWKFHEPHAGRCSLFFHVALRFLPFNMNDWRESLMYNAVRKKKPVWVDSIIFRFFFPLDIFYFFARLLLDSRLLRNICILLIEMREIWGLMLLLRCVEEKKKSIDVYQHLIHHDWVKL